MDEPGAERWQAWRRRKYGGTVKTPSDEMPVVTALAVGVLLGIKAWAGNLDPTNVPGPTMHTLEETYQKAESLAAPLRTLSPTTTVVAAGYYAATNLTQVDPDLTASNVRAGVSLFGVTGDSDVVNTSSGDATANDLLTGKTAWVAGSEVNGAMADRRAVTITPSTVQQTIPQGYHNGSGYVEGDADLVSANIRAGVDIFGVTGDPNVVDTSSGDAAAADIKTGKKAWVDGNEVTGIASVADAPAPVARTGQTPSLPRNPAAAGSDGNLQKGVPWPNPRFSDNANGTVTDNLTGLIWLKDANAFGTLLWSNALTACSTLNSGEHGLADGSVEGDWRLPTIKELLSLLCCRYYNPALSNTAGTGHFEPGEPFANLQSWYWSSSTRAGDTIQAWGIRMYNGFEESMPKGGPYYPPYVWPVRGGQ